MLTIKLGKFINDILLKNKKLISYDHRLYLIRDDNVVFYIGQSKDVITRLMEHIGYGATPIPSSKLGILIANNMEEAIDWEVQLMTIKDCHHIIKQIFPNTKRPTINIAEKALIKKLHPILNTAHNDAPTPLPKKYKLRQDDLLTQRYLPLTKVVASDQAEYSDPDNGFCIIDLFIDHKMKLFKEALLNFNLWVRFCNVGNIRRFHHACDEQDIIDFHEYLVRKFDHEKADEFLEIIQDFLKWYGKYGTPGILDLLEKSI